MAIDLCANLQTRIPALPLIMRRLGWINGAALLERWIQMPANADPNLGNHDTTTIRMDWVLAYERAKKVYENAKKNHIWISDAAKREIVNKLIYSKGSLPQKVGEKINIGNIGENFAPQANNIVQFHKDWHIQHTPVQQNYSDPLDDLYAALGDFAFYYIVKGWAERLPDQNGKPYYRVTIDKVGVYIRDSFDFNDPPGAFFSQPLGLWSCLKQDAAKFALGSSYYSITNNDFRDWRNQYGNGRGGDFLVFSDIKTFNTNTNNTFDFQ